MPGSEPRLLPWEFHPALQADRLRLCARLLASARRDALHLAREELGDDNWSVGCRAFAFGKHRLQRIAQAGEHHWLRVLDGSHHFIFLIEDVPVRFYRGAADDAPDRTLRRQEIEARQLTLVLGEEAATGLVFRFAVETGKHGEAERVVFLALRGDEGEVECFWPVPLEEDAPRRTPACQLVLIPVLATEPEPEGSRAKQRRRTPVLTILPAPPRPRRARASKTA